MEFVQGTIENCDEYTKAKKYALRLLSFRSYSSLQLKTKLQEKSFSEKTILLILRWAEKEGFVSDASLASYWIEKKMKEGFGPFFIQRFLETKGLGQFFRGNLFPKNVWLQAMSKWERLLQGKSFPQKAAFLYRKGFPKDLIVEGLKKEFLEQ